MLANRPRFNIVRNYNELQGWSRPYDTIGRPPRDINGRHISIQNSSYQPIGVAVTSYADGIIPPVRYTMRPGQILEISINSFGDNPQWLWLLDPVTGKPVGDINDFRSDSNTLVIRQGVNQWWVDYFWFPTYAAQK